MNIQEHTKDTSPRKGLQTLTAKANSNQKHETKHYNYNKSE